MLTISLNWYLFLEKVSNIVLIFLSNRNTNSAIALRSSSSSGWLH